MPDDRPMITSRVNCTTTPIERELEGVDPDTEVSRVTGIWGVLTDPPPPPTEGTAP